MPSPSALELEYMFDNKTDSFSTYRKNLIEIAGRYIDIRKLTKLGPEQVPLFHLGKWTTNKGVANWLHVITKDLNRDPLTNRVAFKVYDPEDGMKDDDRSFTLSDPFFFRILSMFYINRIIQGLTHPDKKVNRSFTTKLKKFTDSYAKYYNIVYPIDHIVFAKAKTYLSKEDRNDFFNKIQQKMI